jgi:hypothetical protein
MDEVIDQALTKLVERTGKLCEDDIVTTRVVDCIVAPVISHLSTKFAFQVRVMESIAMLVVLHVLMTVVLLYIMIRR